MVDTNASLSSEQLKLSDVFVLAESYLNPTVCGHAIPFSEWNGSVATTTHRCPICQHPVFYIADGMAASMLESVGDTKVAETTQDITGLVYFKYGKVACHLSVPNSGNRVSSGVWSDWWTNVFSWSLRSSVTSMTAQKRIALALGIALPHLKILHKGKVLYPIVESTFTEESLSDRLIALSSPTRSRNYPPVLLVVGTPNAQQQELLSYEKQQQQQKPSKDVWTTLRTMQATDVLNAIQWMIGVSVRVSLQLVRCVRDSLHHGWKMLRSSSGPDHRTHLRTD